LVSPTIFLYCPLPTRSCPWGIEDLGDYVEEVQALQKTYPGYVLLGIEADYRPHTVAKVVLLLDEHPFDYTIGSVHHLGDWGFDDPDRWANTTYVTLTTRGLNTSNR
jgi:histidinol-phosphatase (PHP family)